MGNEQQPTWRPISPRCSMTSSTTAPPSVWPPWAPPLPSSSCVCHRSTRSTRPLSASPASSPSSPCTTTCASSTPSRRRTLLASRTPRLARSTTTSVMRTLTATSQPELFSTTPTATSTGFSLCLLLTEIILVMGLDPEETRQRCTVLGISSALMIAFGYPGEISAVPTTRWLFWCISMVPFCYIVYTLFIGLKDAQEKQIPEVRSLVKTACYDTVVSWCTYPIVFILPMMMGSVDGKEGLTAQAIAAVQIGYTASDIISKCGVGFLVYKIGLAKSYAMKNDVDCDMSQIPTTPQDTNH